MFLSRGEPAPWFTANCTSNPKYHFGTVAGRYVLLCFLESASMKASQQVLAGFDRYRQIFDDDIFCFFGITTDPDDRNLARLKEQLPGIRFFWDFDSEVSRQFGAIDQTNIYHPCTYVLDERLRVLAVFPFAPQPEAHVSQVIEFLSYLPEIPPTEAASIQAPILVVPRVFEPDLCQALMTHYDQHGGEESGFMREVAGRTVLITDPDFKRRQDQEIIDQNLLAATMHRIHNRLVPEIYKAFQFRATRIERHIVACYDSISGGFFRPHRDNTTKGTAHRRFAVTLNLNAGEYEGGQLRFPEFGRKTYVAPAGGAIVFSCSLLHEATPVTAGRRYAYLPFLYDDAAKKIREMNQQYIGSELQTKGFQPKVKESRKKR